MTIHWHLVDWGAVPEYLAVLPILIALLLLNKQRRGLDADRKALIDQQAHRVTVWAKERPLDLAPERAFDSVSDCVAIENSGDEAVYGVTVVLLVEERSGQVTRAGCSPVPVSPARSNHELHVTSGRAGARLRLEVSFMDSRGNHWVRNEKGCLRQVAFPVEGSAVIITYPPKWYHRVLPRRGIVQKEQRPPEKY